MTIKKVYGPYVVKKGRLKDRRIVLVYYTDGSRKTYLYSRYLIEQKIGRPLLRTEEVDHIDRDKTNDSIDNLQILDKKVHARLDRQYAVLIEQNCIGCNKILLRKARHINGNAKKGKAGPFCRPCAGKYGQQRQYLNIDKLPVQSCVTHKYIYKDKDLMDP